MLIAVVFTGILFTALSIGVNFMTDFMNVGIEDGMLMTQSTTHYGKALVLWGALPLFVLFDIILWALNRVQKMLCFGVWICPIICI